MEAGRPQSKSQRSRKGKRAWRKNVDIEDVEAGLDQKHEHERVFGKDFEDNDFILDTEGDSKLIKKPQSKKLKSQEILDKRSKFPALDVERSNKKKVQGVSKKEIGRLMKLSGRHQGTTASQARLLEDGLVNTNIDDLWAPVTEDNTPEEFKKSSYTEWTTPKNQPKTLKETPISIKQTKAVINSGKSYNPSFESWKALLNEEFVKESSNEEKRQLLKEHQERIKHLIATMNDNEELDSTDDEAEKSAVEVDEDDENIKLSINKPTQVRIKTKTKRNRERKHKEREELQLKLKELKTQIHELEKLEVYEEEVTQKLSNTKKKVAKAPKKLFKYNNLDDQLEIKLSDEISDSLRKLKPEGNLLYDEMKKLQNSGKVEARIPVSKRRKYTPKITEKWTYKDFK
ncbi:ribosome biogenesis protein Nop53p [[Candida] railenensis]|uniref:Ribosome biogenesis protein NOP53 n=1 Tax=[Candida] railenensis TaxID=45579 RepID=A0A9P0QSE7_9ASCO|nr:ribosome biogenesis protein Nop53p [[Candida] railenensis]